ncbi:MAG TPA: sporulation protein YjcZ [Tenericutes bacterium]|jgi:hypothetical protein|nr:sporulation protein YjcZ [Mycoplasmatota bacterium]
MYNYGLGSSFGYNFGGFNPCCNFSGYGFGFGYGAAIILVLFILLVIVLGIGFHK